MRSTESGDKRRARGGHGNLLSLIILCLVDRAGIMNPCASSLLSPMHTHPTTPCVVADQLGTASSCPPSGGTAGGVEEDGGVHRTSTSNPSMPSVPSNSGSRSASLPIDLR